MLYYIKLNYIIFYYIILCYILCYIILYYISLLLPKLAAETEFFAGQLPSLYWLNSSLLNLQSSWISFFASLNPVFCPEIHY